ncbi:MAG: hypothetical protein R3F22_05185 [Lysobacteraceae bacterium]
MIKLDDWLTISEVDDGPFFAEAIFQRKYAQSAPDFPHHVVAFLRREGGALVPASYLHFTRHEDVVLVGGGATDGRAFSQVPSEVAEAIRATGGLLLRTLRFGFRKYANDCDAFFGHCGDPRAFEVDMQAGFQPTRVEHLLAYWHRLLDTKRRETLTDKVAALGPF